MAKYYIPGRADSVVDYSDEYLNKLNKTDQGTITQRQILENSGYKVMGDSGVGNSGTTPLNNMSFGVSPESPVSSTEGLRQREDLVGREAQKLDSRITNVDDFMSQQMNSIIAATPYGQTPEGKARMDELDQIRKNLGLLTDDENRQVDEAGMAAKAEFDPLINESKEQKRLGLPKAVISGGERGGFMNSQIAGAAALTQTEGGSFVGAGGELENVQSAYDRNISDLQARQKQAMIAARAAARAAIMTKKDRDLDKAKMLFDEARQLHESSIKLANEKVEALSRFQQFNEARVTSDLKRLEQIGAVGGSIPDDLKMSLDRVYGQGWSDKYSAASLAAKNAKTKEAQVDAFQKITDILKDYPAGQKITIGDETYETIGSSADTQIFKSEDRAGNVTFVTVDKRTGKVLSTASGGKIGKGSGGSGGGGSSGNPDPNGSDGVDEDLGPFPAFEDWSKDYMQQFKFGDPRGNVFEKEITDAMAMPNEQQMATLRKQYESQKAAHEDRQAAQYNLKTLKSALTASKRSKMIKLGMDPNDPDDIYQYFIKHDSGTDEDAVY